MPPNFVSLLLFLHGSTSSFSLVHFFSSLTFIPRSISSVCIISFHLFFIFILSSFYLRVFLRSPVSWITGSLVFSASSFLCLSHFTSCLFFFLCLFPCISIYLLLVLIVIFLSSLSYAVIPFLYGPPLSSLFPCFVPFVFSIFPSLISYRTLPSLFINLQISVSLLNSFFISCLSFPSSSHTISPSFSDFLSSLPLSLLPSSPPLQLSSSPSLPSSPQPLPIALHSTHSHADRIKFLREI